MARIHESVAPDLLSAIKKIDLSSISGTIDQGDLFNHLSQVELLRPEEGNRTSFSIPNIDPNEPQRVLEILSKTDAIEVPRQIGATPWVNFLWNWNEMLERIKPQTMPDHVKNGSRQQALLAA
ncbi:MAG: hypothetical protein WC666_03195 [Candidatus Paceibacterota bacterium]|jgi:hypothetical protein